MAALWSQSASLRTIAPCAHGHRFRAAAASLRPVCAALPSTSSPARADRALLLCQSASPFFFVTQLPSAWVCNARRKASGSAQTQEEALEDEDLRAGLNETVTEALKVMLAEDDKLVEKFKEKVDFYGEFLVQDGQMEAARFMLILRGMLDHELYPEKDDLQGPYKKAFDTLWGLLEDSGWLLKQPGAEGEEEIPTVDAEANAPVLEIRYSESS